MTLKVEVCFPAMQRMLKDMNSLQNLHNRQETREGSTKKSIELYLLKIPIRETTPKDLPRGTTLEFMLGITRGPEKSMPKLVMV